MATEYSVLMSVYIREKPENLTQSIESMMNQTAPPSDFVLVCDGPLTKELNDAVQKMQGKYSVINVVRRDVSEGLGNALNYGLSHCRYDIVARMDSDDIAIKKRMELQLYAMQKQNADIVSGTLLEFTETVNDAEAARVLPETHGEILRFSKRRNPFNHPCTVFRKSKVTALGGYIEVRWFEDYYLWLRMLKNGCRGYNVPSPVLYMRSGDGMYSRRGGLKYTACALKFRRKMYKEGFCGLSDMVIGSLAHIAAGLVPNRLRIFLYSKLLRKKSEKV